MTELDFYYIVLALGLLGTSIIYFTYKAFEYGDRMAQRDGILCSSCSKRVKYHAKMLDKQEKLRAKKRIRKIQPPPKIGSISLSDARKAAKIVSEKRKKR